MLNDVGEIVCCDSTVSVWLRINCTATMSPLAIHRHPMLHKILCYLTREVHSYQDTILSRVASLKDLSAEVRQVHVHSCEEWVEDVLLPVGANCRLRT